MLSASNSTSGGGWQREVASTLIYECRRDWDAHNSFLGACFYLLCLLVKLYMKPLRLRRLENFEAFGSAYPGRQIGFDICRYRGTIENE